MPNFSVSSQKRLKSWVWSGLHQRSPLAAVWMSGFCWGAVRPLSNDHRRSSLKFTTSSRDLGAPLTLPASVLPLHPPSLQLTALKKRDMRGCLSWMSQWLHISAHPLPSAGRRKANHPSKPCRTTSALAGRSYASAGQAASALHSMAVLQVYQANLLSAIDESEPDPATLRELRRELRTDLALRATKTTAQAIGRSMASLVVLERHLWLTLTEIKDADRVSFLDAPISPSGLFGPAVEGFAERFTEAQKASQAMRHFLPKRSSPAAAQSRPRTAPTQQPAKPAPAVSAPQPARTQQPRGLHAQPDATPLRSARAPDPR